MKDTAVLIGWNPTGKVVYEETIALHDYYDGDHLWDDTDKVLALGLTKVHGELYNPDGDLCQEFEV